VRARAYVYSHRVCTRTQNLNELLAPVAASDLDTPLTPLGSMHSPSSMFQ
jgi:hypothetical protein